MREVIVIPIIECQRQERALMLPLDFFFVRYREFFQGRFQRKDAIELATQVKPVTAQVFSGCLMIIENSQAGSQTPRPPAKIRLTSPL